MAGGRAGQWEEKYITEHRQWQDEKFRLERRLGEAQRHQRTLLEIIERLMDPNRTFRS